MPKSTSTKIRSVNRRRSPLRKIRRPSSTWLPHSTSTTMTQLCSTTSLTSQSSVSVFTIMLLFRRLDIHLFIRSLFIHIVTLNEVMPKEKKQKDEKIQMFGQSTLDLLPILKGNVSVSHLLPVFFTPGSSYELQPPENAQVFIHFISKSHLFVKCINAL